MIRIHHPSLRLLAAALLIVATGCGSARRSEPIAGPMPLASEAVAHGQLVFAQHCHMCHPGGEGGLGPALNDKPVPGFLIKTQVRWGMGDMPSFSEEHIPSDDLDALVRYMAALRGHRD